VKARTHIVFARIIIRVIGWKDEAICLSPHNSCVHASFEIVIILLFKGLDTSLDGIFRNYVLDRRQCIDPR